MLVGDLQLLADLAFADIVLWVPSGDDDFVAVAHARPSSAATLFYRDFVGQQIKPQWRDLVTRGLRDRAHRRLVGARLVRGDADARARRPRDAPALGDRHGSSRPSPSPSSPGTRTSARQRTPSRQELTFNECADELFEMIASGDFPDLGAPTGPRRGAPRASDGLIRLDVDGITTFASPNALSAFNRMGFDDELEGESLAEVTTRLLSGKLVVDESLPLVVTGRAPWRTDIEARGVTVVAAGDPDPQSRRAHRRDRAVPRRHRAPPPGAGAHHQGRDDPRDPPPGEEQPADGGVAAAHPGASHALRRGARGAHAGDAPRRRRSPSCTTRSPRGSRRTSTSTRSSTACCCSSPRSRRRTTRPCTRSARARSACCRASTRRRSPSRSPSSSRTPSSTGSPARRATSRSSPSARDDDAHRAGARHRLRPARGQGRRGPRHADRAHPHPGRARRHDRLAHDHRAAAPRSRSTSRCAGSSATGADAAAGSGRTMPRSCGELPDARGAAARRPARRQSRASARQEARRARAARRLRARRSSSVRPPHTPES